ncbi:MAG: transposase IS4 family protein [Ferroplasma sp. Type II]|uniref:IS1634 family transposase n=1 Tax=Ferroplasma sp. Type II TaxID=261388 RepID=UPI0003894AB0|nr:IS1634 family transposase [Ferroplasma sp. Type II]EQB73973.1 MAG: transposase IS4 family protein [Ferroplasma sp. Type II]
MFLRFTKVKRGSAVLEYASIAERVVENHKQKTITVKYLGSVRSDEDRERYRKILEEYREAMKKFSINDMNVKPTLSFGIFYAARTIMERNGILGILEKHANSYAETLSFMIISRLFDPSSDINFIDIDKRVYYPWETHISEDSVYRSLDSLLEKKDSIELEIFQALKPDTSVVHYDLTSSYFEGREDNDLVLFGYSRDKKRGKEQIVIGLVMADGIPIYHEVWKGNTVDPKTLESTISALKEKFQIKNMILIADRAFGRSKSLDLLDQNQYITAAYRWDKPYRNILMETDFSDGYVMDGLIIKKVTIDVNDVLKDDSTEEQRKLAEKRRYIAVYNKKREELDLKDLNDKIDTVKKKISDITDQKELKKSLGKLKSLVKFTENNTALNEKRIEILKKLAGRFLIVTNTDLNEDEVVSAYKEQWEIERSFRTIKSFLEIRPVYHRKSERVRAHVFVCVLSLLLSRIMEKLTGRTIDSISSSLNYLDVVPVTVENREVYISSESTEASDILKSLGIPYPRIRECAHT